MLLYMQRIMRARKENGASAVEYGLLVAAIAAIIVVIVFALGKLVKGGFSTTCTEMAKGASVAAGSCSG